MSFYNDWLLKVFVGQQAVIEHIEDLLLGIPLGIAVYEAAVVGLRFSGGNWSPAVDGLMGLFSGAANLFLLSSRPY